MLHLERKHLVIGFLLIAAIIFGLGYKAGQVKDTGSEPILITGEEQKEEQKDEQKTDETPPVLVTVHVAGAVERPGVYTFPEGTRVNEAISKAGPSPEADLSFINLAEIMIDQLQIIVPRQGQNQPNQTKGSGQGTVFGESMVVSPVGKVNINTAGAAVLEKLPGIGPVTARKIIDYRSQNGRFKDINDLMKVEGIGEKKLARLKEKVII